MKKMIILLIAISVISLVSAETVTIYPCDDMYTDAVNPNTTPVVTQLWTANYNASGQFQRIMIKFDLELFMDRTLEAATLNLTRLYSCPSGGTTAATFYAITEEWDENTWNYGRSIAFDANINKPFVFSGTGGNAIVNFNVDITDFLQNWLSGEIENHGFVIMANANNKFSKFYSKESPTVEYRPSLTLKFGANVSEGDLVQKYENISAYNYPNPFNPQTTISYKIKNNAIVDIEIYNAKGQLINRLFSGYQKNGTYSVIWNGKDNQNKEVSAGIYFYKISTNDTVVTKPMVMIK